MCVQVKILWQDQWLQQSLLQRQDDVRIWCQQCRVCETHLAALEVVLAIDRQVGRCHWGGWMNWPGHANATPLLHPCMRLPLLLCAWVSLLAPCPRACVTWALDLPEPRLATLWTLQVANWTEEYLAALSLWHSLVWHVLRCLDRKNCEV